MFEEFLHQLVQTHDRVIIPDLGAFLRKDKTDTSEGTLIFSPFLRFNDGLVEDFLVSKKNMTKEEAVQSIRDFVGRVKNDIGDGGDFFVKKMGAFYADARGAAQFVFADNQKDVKKLLDVVRASKSPVASVVSAAKRTSIEDTEIISIDNDSDSESTIKQKNKKNKEKDADKSKQKTTSNDSSQPNKIALATAGLGQWQKTLEERKQQESEKNSATTTITTTTVVTTPPAMPLADQQDADSIRAEAIRIQQEKMRILEERKKGAAQSGSDDASSSGPRIRRRKSGGRVIAVLIILVGVAAAFFIWNPGNVQKRCRNLYKSVVQKVTSGSATKQTAQTELVVDTITIHALPKPKHAPYVNKLQKGMNYLAVARFREKADAVEYCTILLRLEYSKAEIIFANKLYVVSIDKSNSMQELTAVQQDNPYKYGESWILK